MLLPHSTGRSKSRQRSHETINICFELEDSGPRLATGRSCEIQTATRSRSPTVTNGLSRRRGRGLAFARHLPIALNTAVVIACTPILMEGSGTGAKKGE